MPASAGHPGLMKVHAIEAHEGTKVDEDIAIDEDRVNDDNDDEDGAHDDNFDEDRVHDDDFVEDCVHDDDFDDERQPFHEKGLAP